MRDYEVLVIGAGPAGATCAGALVRAGLSVLLVDREQFPRDKPCAGWITPAVFECLGIPPQEYRPGRVLQEIRRFTTGPMFGRELITEFDQTVSYAIRRCEFDHFLLERCGAPALLGCPVQSLERVAGGWLVNRELRARLVIGAGGHGCPAARVLGAHPGGEAAIVALVAEADLGEEAVSYPVPAGHTQLAFLADLPGYGWLLRKGDFVNLGLGAVGAGDLRWRFDRFAAHLQGQGLLSPRVELGPRGHAYLPFRLRGARSPVGEGILLVGDAAGVSSPESGEGILPAIESALLAARVVIAAAGDYAQPRLQPYADLLGARLGRRCSRLGEFPWPSRLKSWGARALLASPRLTRDLVLERWFLYRAEPPLPP